MAHKTAFFRRTKIYIKGLLGYVIFLLNLDVVTSIKAEIYNIQNFDLVRSSSYPHFVMFYAPWCGHCKRVRSFWDEYAEENQKTRRVKVAKIDCTQNIPLCAAENIKGYPTFRLFSNHEKFTFHGNRNVHGFREFVMENVKNLQDWQVPMSAYGENKNTYQYEDNTPVKAKVLTKETFQSEIDTRYTFVDFYAPWCSHCIKLEPVWNQLATRFKHDRRVTITKVDCTAEVELCREHMINSYPTLNLYKQGHMINQYNGDRSLRSLVNFVSTSITDKLVYDMNKDVDEQNILTDDIKEFVPITTDDGEPLLQGKWIDGNTLQQQVNLIPHIVYFHFGKYASSTDILSLFEKFALELTNLNLKVIAVMVDCDSQLDLCVQLKVTAYPSVVYFESVENRVLYGGPISVVDLVRFATQQHEESKKARVEL